MPEPSTILVTGSSRGLGRDLVERFLGRGWRVFGCSRGPAPLSHPLYMHFRADVASETDVLTMFRQIRRAERPLYALINNAGVASMNHALTTPAATLERLLRVNTLGTMLCSREAGKLMAQQKQGRIVNFSSIATARSLEGEAAYVAAKEGVEGYTRVLARELGRRGVTVNAIAPNPIQTDLIAGVPADKLERLVQSQAVPRFGTSEDVQSVIDFFLAPQSALVTGQIIRLGGP